MNELIAVRQSKVSGNEIPTVNARELHGFLGAGKEFANWIKDRIESFGFTENQDYIIIAEFGKNPGRPSKDYHLTLDMAKELSMVERNEKGKQARKYFIECEARLKNLHPQYKLPQTHAETLRMLADTVEQVEAQKKALAEAQPKVEAFDHFIDGVNCKSVARVAQEIGTGQNHLYAFLRQREYLFAGGERHNNPYQAYIDRGFFTVKTTPVKMGEKFVNVSQTLITPKGEAHIAELWREIKMREAA